MYTHTVSIITSFQIAKFFENLIKLLIPVQCSLNILVCILIKFIESIPIPYHDIIFNCIRLQFEVIEEDKFRHAPCTIYGTISVLP